MRDDFESHLNKAVSKMNHYKHTLEGPDDMPAHIKSLLDLLQTNTESNFGYTGNLSLRHRNNGASGL